MEFSTTNMGGCMPPQIINFNYAFNIEDIEKITIYNECDQEYNNENLQYSYSVDDICYSCYMSYEDFLTSVVNLKQDFYLKIKISGIVKSIKLDCEDFQDYSTSLAQGFNFIDCNGNVTQNENQYNPYANMEYAISLQQQLSESVSCMFGIPIYYFKLSPNGGSKDITFKEYALMNIESVKQIKLIIRDGQMPSSKPEFTELSLEWQSDWETEISKIMFATAFGPTAQPMEGDLIYIPMMKRMWMVNEAYDEKNGNLMWTSTTFRLALVKYQQKDSVDLGDTETLVNSLVKNKYEDLFGTEENIEAGEETTSAPIYAANKLYAVYESDAVRKYMTCDPIDYAEDSYYYKGTLISDLSYKFNNSIGESKIIYQREYCGDSGVISFIIKPECFINEDNKLLIEIGNIKLYIKQDASSSLLTLINSPKLKLNLKNNETYFIWLRWSKELKLVELSSALYTHNEKIPLYKLQKYHYYFDIDNKNTSIDRWNVEMTVTDKSQVNLYGISGKLTNFKLFDKYNDNISEILEMYPTSQNLIINDTARKILDMKGYGIR